MRLIREHAQEIETIESDPDVVAMKMGPALADFYAPPRIRSLRFSDEALPSAEELEEIIGDILDTTKSLKSKCRAILREVDLLYGMRGWHISSQGDINHDSGIWVSASQGCQSQSTVETHEDSPVPLHDRKRPREENLIDAPLQPVPKNARVEQRRTRQVPSPQISQKAFAQFPSDADLEQKFCLEPKCRRRRESFKGMHGIKKHYEDVHYPSNVTICYVEEDGKPCNHKTTRKDNLFWSKSSPGHFLRVHGISPDDERLATSPKPFGTFPLGDFYQYTCHGCDPCREFPSRKGFFDHIQADHYKHSDGTGPYPCRCDRKNDTWKNNEGIPEEHRENRRKKVSSGSCDGKDLGDDKRTDEDDDDDDNDNDPGPRKGIRREPCPNRANFNVGGGSKRYPTTSESGEYRHSPYTGSRTCQNENLSGSAVLSEQETPRCVSFPRHPPIGTSDLNRAKRTSKLISTRLLGRGGFGVVDEVRCTTTNKTYARKVALRKKISTELEVLKLIHHQHIINLAGTYTTAKQLWLFLTPVAEQDLGAYLRDCGKGDVTGLNRKLLRKWSGCIVSAVKYLHENDFVHGDIKPQNVLISTDQKVYLADFGCAKGKYLEQTYGAAATSVSALTPNYCAPEVYHRCISSQNWSEGTASDIFSLGTVIAEIETAYTGLSIEAFESFRSAGSGNPAFKANLPRTYLWMDCLWILQELMVLVTYPSTTRVLQTIKDMLIFDPLRRPKTKDVAACFLCFCSGRPCRVSNRKCDNIDAVPDEQYSTSLQLQHHHHSQEKQRNMRLTRESPTDLDFVLEKITSRKPFIISYEFDNQDTESGLWKNFFSGHHRSGIDETVGESLKKTNMQVQ